MSFSDWGESTGIDRRKLIVIVVSVIVGGGALILMLAMLFNKNNAAAQAAPAPGATSVGDAIQDAAKPLEPLVAPPANVTWSPYESLTAPGVVVSLPSSPEYGPAVTGPTYATGFERTSAGVLIAAAQIAARVGESPQQDASVIGPNREQVLSAAGADATVPGEQNSIQGFKFLGQPTTNQVFVDLLIGRGPGFQPSSCTMDMRWADNDWRLYANGVSGCLNFQTAVSAADRATYVSWGPG